MTHVDTTDLSEVSFYTPFDTRAPSSRTSGWRPRRASPRRPTGTEQFSGTVSAEQVDVFDDVDIIVDLRRPGPRGRAQRRPAAVADPRRRSAALVLLAGTTPLGTAANPTPLAISWVLEDYVAMLAEAADKVVSDHRSDRPGRRTPPSRGVRRRSGCCGLVVVAVLVALMAASVASARATWAGRTSSPRSAGRGRPSARPP